MSDCTILYYTANLISEYFAVKIRENILESCNGIPIISISHKGLYPKYGSGSIDASGCSVSVAEGGIFKQWGPFGLNIFICGLEVSVYNVYKQILMGAKLAKTKYVACCEDDALYVPEHFEHRPPDDTFFYNVNRWSITRDFYYYRQRRLMSMCIAPTQLMIDTLETRFAKYPKCVPISHFGEPGRFEHKLGLPSVKIDSFRTEIPTLTFVHRPSLGGKRKLLPGDVIKKELPHWGSSQELWDRIYQ